MGKWFKRIALSVITSVFAVTSLAGPVFAEPNPTTTPSDQTTVTAPADNTANDVDNPEPGEEENPGDESTPVETKSCSDQVGELAWIVCSGTGLLSKVVDGAYNILSRLMKVDPLPRDNSSPFYIVWNYFKDITNLIFVIFFLIVIFSQLTGVGINNYGIKKILPRIIITAILVNLSYIICQLAVDVSNILGSNFRGFFENIENIAIQNGAISAEAQSTSIAGLVAAILGIGAVGTAGIIGAAVYAGGIEGLIWMLIPVILTGVVAVVSALVTMAARQALIFLLVMISPLALVAYMLPNTEKWFTKWYRLFARMIFFYPLFSILYGASSLAGLVLITSANGDALRVVLGIAVKILPLFLSIPLMRMSGTVLDKVSGAFNRISSPALGAVSGYAAANQALAKQKQLNKQNPRMPSTRLAQFLERRRAQREFDTKELSDRNKEHNMTLAMAHWENRRGKINSRGRRHWNNMKNQERDAAIRMKMEADFDEGFDPNDRKRVGRLQARKVARIKSEYDDVVVQSHIAQTRKHEVDIDQQRSRAETIRGALNGRNAYNSRIQKQVHDIFNIDRGELTAALRKQERREALTDSERHILELHDTSKNFVLSNAIALKRKADKDRRDTFYELYDDTTAGGIPKERLIEAFKNKDVNSLVAAAQVMAKRGDQGDINEVFEKYSHLVAGDNDARNIRFQKELNDFCLSQKGDNSVLWAWGKANMIRRGKHDAAGAQLASFIDFDSFVHGRHMEGDAVLNQDMMRQIKTKKEQGVELSEAEKLMDKNATNLKMVDFHSIFEGVRDNKLVADMDRTVFKRILEMDRENDNSPLPVDSYYFTWMKGFRDSLCSGKMDGEQLDSFNSFMTMGFGTGDPSLFYKSRRDTDGTMKHNYDIVDSKLDEFFRDMSANQLASLKSGSFFAFNDAMNKVDELHGNTGYYVTRTAANGKTYKINNRLLERVDNAIEALNKHNMSGTRSGMNPIMREILGIHLD